MSGPPSVVALGGGHGTAVTLRALREYAGSITAVVSVADDGGSSGRLREVLGVPALGDLRKCLVALAAPGSTLAETMDHRFREGEMAGHALGNLLLAGLIEQEGGLVSGIAAAAALVEAEGTILPATEVPVRLWATGPAGTTVGQAAIGQAAVEIVAMDPADATPPPGACEAIMAADQVVIGPGSLYTSVLAALLPTAIREAIRQTEAQRVFVCNLRPQVPETEGYDVARHLRALACHGVEVDVVLCDTTAGMEIGDTRFPVRDEMLAGSNRLVHDPSKLASHLQGLIAWGKIENKEK